MLRPRHIPLALCALTTPALIAAQSVGPQAPGALPDPEAVRPIEALDSVFIEDLTWLEVRDALRAGRTTVLVAAGGVELNGPYLALGRRNAVAKATAAATAKLLGNALVAPVIPFSPAPEPKPVSAYPGTIHVSEESFCQLLHDVVLSLAQDGFEEVVLLGDGQASQQALQRTAHEFSKKPATFRVRYVPEFGDTAALAELTAAAGIVEKNEGFRDDFVTSAMLMAVDPQAVRMEQRLARGLFSINGVSLAPAYNTIELGRRLIEQRAELTAAAIRGKRSEDEG